MAVVEGRIYFGYGSNLWLDQMKRRCPQSEYIGVGVLDDWKWIINDRGYANIVPSRGDLVYGLMYTLTAEDEASLDIYEGSWYGKQQISIKSVKSDPIAASKRTVALAYIDETHQEAYPRPKTEYIYRMNMAIEDAVRMGVPADYIDKYLRIFIPLPSNSSLE